MGTPEFAAVSLERLLASPHEIVLVVTQADRPAGRGHKLRYSPVKELALDHHVELLQPLSARDRDFVAAFAHAGVDLAVVVAYGKILPTSIIDAPRLGCINAHASLLPALRGAAPIERAILEGYDQTGVSIMRINQAMDAGDVLSSRSVAITADTDGGSLRDSLALVSADLLVTAIDDIAAGRAHFVPQDEAMATYAPPLSSTDARIDWSRSAIEIDRQVRALRPKPGAFAFHDGTRVKILAGHVRDETSDVRPATILEAPEDELAVACGSGVFVVEQIQAEGRRAMSAGDYRRGRKNAGACFDHTS